MRRNATGKRPSLKDQQQRAARAARTSGTRDEQRSGTVARPAFANPLAFLAAVIVTTVLITTIAATARSCASDQTGTGAAPGQPPSEAPEAAASASTDEPDADPGPDLRHDGPYSVSFASTGDIIFGREVGTFVDENGGAAAMANVADALAAADVTIANVEAPLSDDDSEPIPDKDVYLISRPAGIESLVASDVTFASLANNHSMDYSAPALKDTIDALDAAGIKHAGAGMTENEADQIAEVEVNGASIAFISWTDVIPENFVAYGDNAGVASARLNMDAARKKVEQAKQTHDIVIVAMHWGIEYEDYTTASLQNDPAHELADAGADVIIGNHPHVIQGIEFYNDSLISYSQGDFVFDHYSEKTGETFILNFDISQDGISNVVATPVYLDDTYGIPSIVEGDHAQSILERLATISEGMNSNFDIEGDKAYISPT